MSEDYYNLCILSDYTHSISQAALERFAADHSSEIVRNDMGTILSIQGNRVIDDPDCTFFKFTPE